MIQLFSRKSKTPPLVSFLVAGTQKGGTTALNKYLKSHPGLMMASGLKEVHYFDNENLDWNRNNHDYYHSFFKQRRDKMIGETTPVYMYWNGALQRIHRYNPAMKFVITLRNPVERAFSHWNMEWDKKNERLCFWDALHAEPRRHRRVHPLQSRHYSYVDRGYYAQQLKRLWQIFPASQTLVIRNTDLIQSSENTLNRISSFLEIQPFQQVRQVIANARSYSADITPREVDFLLAKFHDEIRELENLLNWDCSDWLKPPSRLA